ncbi:hypothetical protein WICPIJ_007378 [Wickerhamomyces pijperi]|uniref:Uncharacterized protein n=1 Tax=Wickerhamomyces pijperi TaxID=599730 RepID=A0A9P8Q0M9_WICPI|nr:hypothetical protein WICPIJ_007378 [Wickerhamomyces pijperi]
MFGCSNGVTNSNSKLIEPKTSRDSNSRMEMEQALFKRVLLGPTFGTRAFTEATPRPRVCCSPYVGTISKKITSFAGSAPLPQLMMIGSASSMGKSMTVGSSLSG